VQGGAVAKDERLSTRDERDEDQRDEESERRIRDPKLERNSKQFKTRLKIAIREILG
jgi:hypothetical protein